MQANKFSKVPNINLYTDIMTLYDFKSRDKMEQLEAYWEGVYVGKMFKDGKEFECKQIDDFYVEYIIEGDLSYGDMKCHKNTKLIEPYLGKEPLNLI